MHCFKTVHDDALSPISISDRRVKSLGISKTSVHLVEDLHNGHLLDEFQQIILGSEQT